MVLSPDYQRSRKRKSDQTKHVTDTEVAKKPSLDVDIQEEEQSQLEQDLSLTEVTKL